MVFGYSKGKNTTIIHSNIHQFVLNQFVGDICKCNNGSIGNTISVNSCDVSFNRKIFYIWRFDIGSFIK